MGQEDLAGTEHWDRIYKDMCSHDLCGWRPVGHDAQALEAVFCRAMKLKHPASILEVGCGNSTWLGYLARSTGATAAGIDYSQEGCLLARSRLEAEHVPGIVVHGDLFLLSPDEVGRHDFVYSLGLAEHFDDLRGVLSALARFVAPGGVLLTEVPNLRSMHGLLAWIWQPALLAKHRLVSKSSLYRAYAEMGFTDIRAGYAGVFSLNIVAWEYYPRWPRLAPKLVPRVRRVQGLLSRRLRRFSHYPGNKPFSPFLYVYGRKPAE